MRWTALSGTLWIVIAALWWAHDAPGRASDLALRLAVPEYTAQYHQEPDPLKRARLVEALGRRGSPVYRPLLEAAARDPDPRVRTRARQRLAGGAWALEVGR